ncbi:MAG: aminopeptidase [Acidobacteria bacterium]|nr:aminopeptidase [Acidobacteriota bacterium]
MNSVAVADPSLGLDEYVWAGIQSLMDDYIEIGPADDVVIAYTPDSRDAAAWVCLAFQERGFTPALVPMAPLRDPGFYNRLSAVIPERRDGHGRCVCLLFELHTMSHNKTVKTIFSKYCSDQYKVIRAINSGRDLFATGLTIHPDELSALNTAILERCGRSKRLRIETEGGTNLEVELDNSKFRWLSNCGVNQPGKFLIIPSGEIATYPAKINGTLVADFAINVNMYYDDDARLKCNPVTIEIEDGVLTKFSCSNPDVSAFLNRCFSRNNAKRVGELGFGTNKAVDVAVPENSHLNERVPGIHIGFGQHNQTVEATGYFCDIHVDLCAKGGLIWFDESIEPIDLSNVAPSQNPHPILVNSEDIFSEDAEEDCCGMIS